MEKKTKSLDDTTCKHCKCKKISYPGQHCRKQYLLSSSKVNNNNNKINERSIQFERSIQLERSTQLENELNPRLNEFIKRTQLNSECCDDFIEWVPNKNLENIKFLAKGGNSKVFQGIWSNTSLDTIALKVIINSDNINESVINEFKMHHKCCSESINVIPFYGITKSPEGNDYAMVIGHAEHGDLRKYIREFFPKLTWTDKINILIEISKALNSLHQINLVHMDFHCKNILVDKDNKIFISDFGLCQPINSEIVLKEIQGVLPYIAPEVLKKNPYTKQSEVYSLSIIMWELTSGKPPFNDRDHDKELALSILFNELRPEIIEGTPDFYVNIMKQCWDSDPLKRPDSSFLPKLFEEMLELCKMDNNIVSSNIALVSLDLEKPKYITSRGFPTGFSESEEKISKTNENTVPKENITEPDYKTSMFEYTLSRVECVDSYSQTVESGVKNLEKELLEKADEIIVDPVITKVVKEKADKGKAVEKVQESVPVLGKHQSQNQKALAWLHAPIHDEKLEKEILESCEKVVVERVSDKKIEETKKTSTSSWTSWLSKSISEATQSVADAGSYTTNAITQTAESATALLQSRTTPEVTKNIVSTQNLDGSIRLNKTVSTQIDLSPENIQSSVKTYGVSEKLQKVPKSEWETALSIRNLIISSPQSQDQYKKQSDKAKEYLLKELKDEKLVEEVLNTSDRIIVEQSVQKENKEAVAAVSNSTSPEKAKEIVSYQNDDGSLTLTDTVSKELNVDSLVYSIKSHFDNRSAKISESKSLIDTAVTMSFLRKTSSFDTSPELKEKYEKASIYLISQLDGDEKLEKELLEKTDQIVVEQVTTKVVKEKADKAVVEKAQESVLEEEVDKIVETQNEDGSFDILQKITEDLNQTTIKDISTSIHITDERVEKFDTKVWSTFITIAYCNKVLGKYRSKLTTQNQRALTWLHEQVGDEKLEKEILESCEKAIVEKVADKEKAEAKATSTSSWTSWLGKSIADVGSYVGDYATKSIRYLTISSPQSQDQYKEQSDKAKAYLAKELKDEKLVEELLTTSDRIIVEQSVQKEKKEAAAAVPNSTSPKKAKEIVSCPNSDGSIELTDDTVSKELSVPSTDSLVSSIKSYFGSKQVKLPESKPSYDTSPELKEKYEKAKSYLVSQLGGDKNLEKELLEKTDQIVVEQVTKKVVKKKADKAVVEKVQESVLVEEAVKIIETQNEDGSFEIHQPITEDLGQTAIQNIPTSIHITDEDSQEITSDKIIEQSNQDDYHEDSRYVTQTYNFSLDDLQLAS